MMSTESTEAAFGHNDLTTDNAFYWKDCDHLKLGLPPGYPDCELILTVA